MAIERPDNKAKHLLDLLVDYRHQDHNISSFGYNFLDNINPVTGRLHSIYRTDRAETGRFQSGDSDNGFFNSQNIPKEKDYRTPFHRKGYTITTCDLSGAEVTIMCDKANDRKLYEWAVINDDAHSPIATACWRNVYLFRAGMRQGLWTTSNGFFQLRDNPMIYEVLTNSSDDEVKRLLLLFTTFVIDKKNNKDMRTQFKSMTFGTVYGMYPKKGGKTLNIPQIEAEVVITTIKRAIPDTFKYVEGNIEFALENGYIHLDDRTNSRVLFPDVIKMLREGGELTHTQRSAVDGAARNYPIQGTQASMVKEAMVEIYLYFKHHKIDASIINMVHDELVVRQLPEYDGINGDKTVTWFSDEAKKAYNPRTSLIQPLVGLHVGRYINNIIEQGQAKQVSIPEFVKLTMSECANRYLTHFKMGADVTVADTWTK